MAIEGFKQQPLVPTTHEHTRNYVMGGLSSLQSYIPHSFGYLGTSWVGKTVVVCTTGAVGVFAKLVAKVSSATEQFAKSRLTFRIQQSAPDLYNKVSNAVIARAEDTLSKEELARHAALGIASFIPIPYFSNAAGIAASGHATVTEGQKWTFRRAKENLIPQMTQLIWYTAPILLKLMEWSSQKVGNVAESVEKKAWSLYEHPEAFGEFFVRVADKWYSAAWSRSQRFEYIKPGQSTVHLTAEEKKALTELTKDDIEAVEFLVATHWDPLERQKARSQNDPQIYQERLLEQFKLLSFDERLRMVPGQIAKMPQVQKAEIFNFVVRKAPLETHERAFLAQVRKTASHGNWSKLSLIQQEKLNQLLANAVNRVEREHLVDLLIPPLHRLWALDLDTTLKLIDVLLERNDLSYEDRNRLENMEEIDKKGLKFISKMLLSYLSPAEKILLYNDILSHEPLSLSKQTVECMLKEHVKGEELDKAMAVLQGLTVPPEEIADSNERGVLVDKPTQKISTIRSIEAIEKELASHGITDLKLATWVARNSLGLIPLVICQALGWTLTTMATSISHELTKQQYEKLTSIPIIGSVIAKSLITIEKDGGYKIHFAPDLLDLAATVIPHIPGYQGLVRFTAEHNGLMPFFKYSDTLLVAVPTATGRFVYTTVAEVARLTNGAILSMKQLHDKVETLVKARELATQVDTSAIAKVESMHKMAVSFNALGGSIEKYCRDAKSIANKLCSPTVQDFFLSCAVQDSAVDMSLKLDKLGITPEEAFAMSKTIRSLLETGTMPTEILAGDGTTIVGYILSPITDALRDSLSFFGSALKKAASTVFGEKGSESLKRGVKALKAMPILQDTATHLAKKANDAWNIVTEGVESLTSITTNLPPDVLSSMELFFNAAKEYQSAYILQTAAEEAHTTVQWLMSTWYSKLFLDYGLDITLGTTNIYADYIQPLAAFAIKRVQDFAQEQLMETEAFQASLDKQQNVDTLLENGMKNIAAFTAKQMEKNIGEGLRYRAASSVSIGINLVNFMFASEGHVTLQLFGKYVLPELVREASNWLRVNGKLISDVGLNLQQTGWTSQKVVADAITKSLRFVTGKIDPKKTEAFIALNPKEKLHLAQLVAEKSDSDELNDYIQSLQKNVDYSQEKKVVEQLLKTFSHMPEHEKLKMSPTYYDDLSPVVQDRITGLVSRYVGLTEKEAADSAVIARKFNSLDDSIREKIDEVSWWEFAQMDKEDQQDLLFKVIQDPDWSDETGFVGRMKLLQETRFLSNRELKRMLKFQSTQDSTSLVFTPSYLSRGPISKVIHALDLIKKYNITLYGQLLTELRRIDKSPNEEQFKESIAKRIVEGKEPHILGAIACALSLLPEHERREFYDFTIEEFAEKNSEDRLHLINMLVGQKIIGIDILTKLQTEKPLSVAQRELVISGFNRLPPEEKRDFRLASQLGEKLSQKTKEALLKALTTQITANEVIRHQLHNLDIRKNHLAFTATSEKEKKELREILNSYPALQQELKAGTDNENALLATLGRKPFDEHDKVKADAEAASVAKKLVSLVTNELDKQAYITILVETNKKSIESQADKKSAELDAVYRNFEKYVVDMRNKIAELRDKEKTATDENLVKLELQIAILQKYLKAYEAALSQFNILRIRFGTFITLVKSKTLADLVDPTQDRDFIAFYAENFEKTPDGTPQLPPTKQELQERRKVLSKSITKDSGLTYK